jgi:hypothetical protein
MFIGQNGAPDDYDFVSGKSGDKPIPLVLLN